MTSSWTKRKPVLLGLAASFLLTVLIVAGSRNLVIPRYFIYLALAGWIATSVGLVGKSIRNAPR